MPLSWNEIKSRALAFTNECKDEVSEDAEAKSFWDDFFFLLVGETLTDKEIGFKSNASSRRTNQVSKKKN